jgi:hypothetical protein
MSFGLIQEWVPSEDEVPADHWSKSPEYLKEKAAAEGREYVPVPMYQSSEDKVDRLLSSSKELREAMNPAPVNVGQQLAETQKQRDFQKAKQALVQAVKDLSRYAKADNIIGIAKQALYEVGK